MLPKILGALPAFPPLDARPKTSSYPGTRYGQIPYNRRTINKKPVSPSAGAHIVMRRKNEESTNCLNFLEKLNGDWLARCVRNWDFGGLFCRMCPRDW